MKERSIFVALSLILSSFTSPSAWAACSVTSFSVGSMAFDPYDVFNGTATTQSCQISFTASGCTNSNVKITLGRGLYATTFNPRKMASGSDRLNYNLYLDATCLTIWGSGSGGTSAWQQKPPNGVTTITVYGKIPAGQDVPAGSYSDTVVATVNF